MGADLAEREICEKDNLMPKEINLTVGKIEFFDSLSDPLKPEPKVWAVEDGRGCYTLFDHPGVDPTDRQRREAAAETQRRLQSDIAELTRTRDQELRGAESEYRQAELTARQCQKFSPCRTAASAPARAGASADQLCSADAPMRSEKTSGSLTLAPA